MLAGLGAGGIEAGGVLGFGLIAGGVELGGGPGFGLLPGEAVGVEAAAAPVVAVRAGGFF